MELWGTCTAHRTQNGKVGIQRQKETSNSACMFHS